MGSLSTSSKASAALRQERFIELYLGECFGNAGEAALRAGYSAHTASSQGPGLLRNPRVLAAIEERKKINSAKYAITADRILGEYAAIAFSNVLDYTTTNHEGVRTIDLNELTREEGAAISEISVEEHEEIDPDTEKTYTVRKTKFKLHPKLPALEALAKYKKIPGIGTTKIDLTNSDGSLRPMPTLIVNFIEPGRPASKQIEGK